MKNTSIGIFVNSDDFLDELSKSLSDVEGFDVSAATTNGNTAIELIKHSNLDVAVVDLVLIGLDGFGVLDYLKSN